MPQNSFLNWLIYKKALVNNLYSKDTLITHHTNQPVSHPSAAVFTSHQPATLLSEPANPQMSPGVSYKVPTLKKATFPAMSRLPEVWLPVLLVLAAAQGFVLAAVQRPGAMPAQSPSSSVGSPVTRHLLGYHC